MRKAILLVLGVASIGIPAAAAGGLPYCIKGCDFGGGRRRLQFLFLSAVSGDGFRA